MSASSDLTWDQDPPKRPTIADLGGATKENHPKYPPNAATDPTAEEFNQFAKQHAAVGKCQYLAKLHVQISGGDPSIVAVQAPGSNVEAGDFTIVDNGPGDTTIWWTTGTGGLLPPTTGYPEVSQTDDTEIDRLRAIYTSVSGNPAVQIKSKLGAVATDCNFVVTIN